MLDGVGYYKTLGQSTGSSRVTHLALIVYSEKAIMAKVGRSHCISSQEPPTQHQPLTTLLSTFLHRTPT